MFDAITEGIRKWLVARFASAIRHTTRTEDRVVAIRWLSESRDVIASELPPTEKFKKLNGLVSSRTAIVVLRRAFQKRFQTTGTLIFPCR